MHVCVCRSSHNSLYCTFPLWTFYRQRQADLITAAYVWIVWQQFHWRGVIFSRCGSASCFRRCVVSIPLGGARPLESMAVLYFSPSNYLNRSLQEASGCCSSITFYVVCFFRHEILRLFSHITLLHVLQKYTHQNRYFNCIIRIDNHWHSNANILNNFHIWQAIVFLWM